MRPVTTLFLLVIQMLLLIFSITSCQIIVDRSRKNGKHERDVVAVVALVLPHGNDDLRGPVWSSRGCKRSRWADTFGPLNHRNRHGLTWAVFPLPRPRRPRRYGNPPPHHTTSRHVATAAYAVWLPNQRAAGVASWTTTDHGT